MNEEKETETQEINAQETEAQKRKKNLYRSLYEAASWILVVAAAVLAAYLTNNYLICNAVIPTGSMENTIMPGDRIFGNRLSYLNKTPQRGDIVIFKSPLDSSKLLVKRVVGLPGETVDITDGAIYIDGSEIPLEEPYRKEEWFVENTGYHFEVPEGCYLMLGDNRNNSEDARYWEKQFHINPYISEDDILAKAFLIYWPFSHFGTLD